MEKLLTIAICTYNRQDYIIDCLNSLASQTGEQDRFKVIVIDNNSTDDTPRLLAEYDKLKDFKVIRETKQGLSHARNAAIEACDTKFLFYLDDDAKAHHNLVSVAYRCIEDQKLDVFGGVYLPWYKHGRPYWMKDSYVQSPNVGRKSGYLGKGEYLSGGIFCARLDLLKKYGGFNPELGMTGTTTAYGEETELQNRMRKDGYKMYLASDLLMDHLVAEYKLNLQWFFKSNYLKGRDIVGMEHWNYDSGRVARLIFEGVAMFLVKTPINLIKLTRPNYCVENFLIDSYARIVKRVGMISRLMELKKRS